MISTYQERRNAPYVITYSIPSSERLRLMRNIVYSTQLKETYLNHFFELISAESHTNVNFIKQRDKAIGYENAGLWLHDYDYVIASDAILNASYRFTSAGY